MAIALRCTKVRRSDGKLLIDFADGVQLEFESVQQARQEARQFFDSETARDFLRMLHVARLLTAAADGSTPAAIEARTITLDLGQPRDIVRIV